MCKYMYVCVTYMYIWYVCVCIDMYTHTHISNTYQVCDHSGSITCLYTANVRRGGKTFGAGKGTVLSLTGHVVCAQGRMLLMVSAVDFPAAKVKTFESSEDGYGHVINASHPNNLSQRPHSFAVLLLRGSKCVLARSLASPPEWPGNRLPQARAKARESGPEAAISAACQQLDLDKEEFHFRNDLPPVVYYRTLPSGCSCVANVFVMCS